MTAAGHLRPARRPDAGPAVRKRNAPAQRGLALADLIGLAPAVVLFGIFILVPLLGAVVLSFFRWNGLGSPHWAGGANWAQFAHDPIAGQSLAVTAKVVALSWVVQTPISLALGMFTAGGAGRRPPLAGHPGRVEPGLQRVPSPSLEDP